MFENMSIQKKMNALVSIATISIVAASLFVFTTMSDSAKHHDNQAPF